MIVSHLHSDAAIATPRHEGNGRHKAQGIVTKRHPGLDPGSRLDTGFRRHDAFEGERVISFVCPHPEETISHVLRDAAIAAPQHEGNGRHEGWQAPPA